MKEKKNINLHLPPPQQSKKEKKNQPAPFPPSHNEFVKKITPFPSLLSTMKKTFPKPLN
jgi:hypothetical protein